MTDSTLINTSSADFFERKYQEKADPWNFGCSAYEQARYDVTMAALDGRRFERAFEPGCSVGVLTERLARVCEHVDAMDLSATAVNAARSRCAGLSNVSVEVGSLSDPLPAGSFDLLVLSEIGYYFDEQGLNACAGAAVEKLVPGGCLLAVHWLGHSQDHRLSGDQVHEVLRSLPGVRLDRSERHPGFQLDRWTKQ